MIPHPFDRYEQGKTHQQQLRQAAELARRAKEASAASPQRAAHALVLWLKALGKALAALASSRASSPKKAAASALNHACVQPGSARHPHESMQAEHVPCRSSCVPGHVG